MEGNRREGEEGVWDVGLERGRSEGKESWKWEIERKVKE